MSLRVTTSVQKKALPENAAQKIIDDYLRRWATAFKKAMTVYPPDQPWKSRMPKSGPRANGARTGAYGAGWRGATTKFTKTNVQITNEVPYAAVVGGSRRKAPGQARVLAARGWQSVDDVGPEVSRRIKPKMFRFLSGGTAIGGEGGED